MEDLGEVFLIYKLWTCLPGEAQAVVVLAFIPAVILISDQEIYKDQSGFDYFDMSAHAEGYCDPTNYTTTHFKGSQLEDVVGVATIWQQDPVMAVVIILVGIFIIYKVLYGPIQGTKRTCMRSSVEKDNDNLENGTGNDDNNNTLQEMMAVQIPPTAIANTKMEVRTPDGQLMEILLPPNIIHGQTMQVPYTPLSVGANITPPVTNIPLPEEENDDDSDGVRETCCNTAVLAEKHAFGGSWPKNTLKLSTRSDDEDALKCNKNLTCFFICMVILIDFSSDILTPVICILTCYKFITQMFEYGDCTLGRDEKVQNLIIMQGNYVLTIGCLFMFPYVIILIVNIYDWIVVKCCYMERHSMKNKYLKSFHVEKPKYDSTCCQRLSYEMKTGWMGYCRTIMVDTVGILLLPLSDNSGIRATDNGCISGFRDAVCPNAFYVNLSTWFSRAVPTIGIMIVLRIITVNAEEGFCKVLKWVACILNFWIFWWYYLLRCLYDTLCCFSCVEKQLKRNREAREKEAAEREERLRKGKIKRKQFEKCMTAFAVIFTQLFFAMILILAFKLGYSNVILGVTDENGRINLNYIFQWNVDFPDITVNLNNFRFPIVWMLIIKTILFLKICTVRSWFFCASKMAKPNVDVEQSARRTSQAAIDKVKSADINVDIPNVNAVTVDVIIENGEMAQEAIGQVELVKKRTEQAILATQMQKDAVEASNKKKGDAQDNTNNVESGEDKKDEI